MFHMYDKKFISVTSHALDPLSLSQTVTLSQTPSPSSVTYFMDGPVYIPAEQHSPQLYSSRTASRVYYFNRTYVLQQNSIVCSYTHPGSGDPWEWRPVTQYKAHAQEITSFRSPNSLKVVGMHNSLNLSATVRNCAISGATDRLFLETLLTEYHIVLELLSPVYPRNRVLQNPRTRPNQSEVYTTHHGST